MIEIPAIVWKIAAAMYGANLGIQALLGYRGYKVQEKGIEAGLKGQQYQAALGKQEEKRTSELMQKMLSFKRREGKEERELDALKLLMGSKNQQTALMMAAMSALGQNRPNLAPRSFPPSSIVSLLQ